MSRNNSNTRQKILRATWRLLEDQPGESVSMAAIAKAAGISRQALYLHFPARAELLIATARYLDEVFKVDERLVASRQATTGRERLDAFVEAWGNYIPEIYGISRAFMALQATDEAAAAAWTDRMQAVRHGCAAAVKALADDGDLADGLTVKRATDLLWMLLSVENWQHLRQQSGWSQKAYIAAIRDIARRTLLRAG
jgi:AcrR family transcriptional regulator